MAEQVEQLLIRIGVDVADLKKGMADATKSIQGLDDTTKDTAKGLRDSLGAGLTFITARLVPFVAGVLAASKALDVFQSSMNQLQFLGRLSQISGIAVADLDALRQAAAQSGIDFETLSQAISGFAQRTQELRDPLSSVSLALGAMGVSARDSQGNLRTLFDLLPELADRFASYADGVGKAQLAAALFGEEAGPRLLRLLNQGRAGIEGQIAAMRQQGTVTDAQVRVADEYKAAQERLSEATSRLAREFSATLAPALTTAANVIADLLRLLPSLPEGMRTAATEAERLTRQIEMQESVVRSAQSAADSLVRRYGEAARNSQAYRDALERVAAAEARLLDLRRQLDSVNEAIPITPRSPAPSAPDTAALQAAAREAITEANFQLQQLQERLNGSRTILDEMNFAWMSHAEIVAAASEHINQAYQTQGDRRRALANIETMLNKQQQAQILSTAQLAGQVLTQLFPKNKNAAIAAAVINTAVGITKALSELLPPFSWIQAGLIAASGAAQIATIRSTTQSGGGATPSPGGGGAGEQPTGEAAAPGRALHIQGVDPGAFYSGRALENLIASINTEVQDGATLITTKNLPT